jgi:hypothetical protein
MEWFWLAVMGVSLAPIAVVSFVLNPIVLVVLGPDVWRSRLVALRPYAWWIAASFVACALATVVFGARYG